MKTKKYCYITPSFPLTAYLPFVTVSYSSHRIALLPLNFIFVTLAEISDDIQIVREQLEQENLSVEEQCTLLPVKLDKLHPLHERYWKQTSYPFRPENRHKLLIDALSNFSFCRLLVTPWSVKIKPHLFTPAIPLYNFSHKNISQFLQLSNFPVDSAARLVGTYRCLTPMKFNWEKREMQKRLLKKQEITN